MKNVRQWIGHAVCLLALSIGPAPADAPRYAVTDLGASGQESCAEAINNQGQVVGWQGTGSFLWDNGTRKIISAQPYQGAHGINEAGQIVGIPGEVHTFSGSTLTGASAFVWDRGHVDYLPGFSEAYAINARGQIAGESSGRATLWERRHVSGALNDAPNFIWQSLPARKIGPVPGYPAGVFYGLNDAGEAVGVLLRDRDNLPEHGRAFRYQDGKPSLLPLPAPGDSAAFSINATGAIAGAERRRVGQWQAVLWRPDDTMQTLPPLPGCASTVAHAINAGGEIVGWAFGRTDPRGASLDLSFGPGPDTRACLWRGGVAYDLNALIPAGSGWNLREARAVNDRGWIVGSGSLRGEQHAFLLRPAP